MQKLKSFHPNRNMDFFSTTEFGKRVKKWVESNRYTVEEISHILDAPIEACVKAYENYAGRKLTSTLLIVGNKKQQIKLKGAILNKEFIILYGPTGVGKTSLVRKIAEDLGYRIVNSYARSNEDLVHDFVDLPKLTTKTIFCLESDGFYWRTYAIFKNYITTRQNPIIVICNDVASVNKNISKLAEKIKVVSPTKSEVYEFIREKFPDWNGNLNDVYDGDMRITLRNLRFDGKEKRTIVRKEKIDARKLTYLIFRGRATFEDFERCSQPWEWVLGWLSYNCYKFYKKEKLIKNLELLSWIDTYKYNYKKKYLWGLLINDFIPTIRNDGLGFPPFPPKKQKIVKKGKTEIKHRKIKTPRRIKKVEPKIQRKLPGFMVF